jgi:hypothetical protein
MHDQVTLQTSEVLPAGGQSCDRRSELEERWQELLGREMHYRSSSLHAAATG